jgi:hypothetical protein
MPQILVIEIAALLLAAVGNSLADSLYLGGRLSPRVHALWVASSSTAMCLPLLTWVIPIFVGPGALASGAMAALLLGLFGVLYCQIRAVPALPRAGCRPLPATAEKAPPPASG